LTGLQWVNHYSEKFDTFNDKAIKDIRKNDEILLFIDACYKEISRNVPSNISYLGYRFDDNANRFRELNTGSDKHKTKKETAKTMNIYDTYARLAIYMFKITVTDQQTNELISRYVEIPIYIPLYIDDYHFYIKGSLYAIPFQITDSITFSNRTNLVILKTMTRAIKMNKEKKVSPIADVHGNKYISYVYYIYLLKKKIPFLLFYFAYFGFNNTFRYFGADKYCRFFDSAPLEPEEATVYFKFGQIFIGVDRKEFENNYLLRQFVSTVLELQKRGLNREAIESTTRWKIILGSTISEINPLVKGEGLLRTFVISLDYKTIENIKNIIGGPPKETTFAMIRYIFLNFSTLSSKSNSLLNKRIRLSEWVCDPFIRETYKKLYRFISTPEKNKDLNRCIDIIKIPSGFILGAICGKNKRSLSLNIAKYSSSVNDNSLLNVALKVTSAGPGSPFSKSGSMVSVNYRKFDTSYLGKICITTSSNSEPGISSVMTPFCRIDEKSLTFVDD
jgi:hypothetical protein